MHAALSNGSFVVARPAWLKTAMSRPINRQRRREKCAEGFENSDFSALKMFFIPQKNSWRANTTMKLATAKESRIRGRLLDEYDE
jgi:hypothetical protein